MARKRVVLNPMIAREIESLAPTFADRMRRGTKTQLSNMLSIRFGVDAKTIRDIWNRKTWKEFNEDNAKAIADSFLSAEITQGDGDLQQWDAHLSLQNLLEMNPQ